MVRWLGILLGTLRSTVRTHRELALENLALRQQLAVWKARQPRPGLTAMDRGRRTRVCRARCARFVILLFALSVASGDSPAHDGDAIGAAAPSGSRLSTSAKTILALTAHSPRLTAERSISLPPLAVYAARRAVIGPRTLVAS